MTANDELERLRKTARAVNALAWLVVAGIMVYGIPIVYGYLTKHGVPKGTAWILSLAVDGALAVGLVATPILAEYGIKGGWVGALRWIAGLATWALNTAESWTKTGGPDIGGVFSHTWGPLMMFFAVEGAAYFQRKIAEVIRRKTAEAEQRNDDVRNLRKAAEEADRKRTEAEAVLRAEQRKNTEAEEALRAEEAARKAAEQRAEEQAAAWAEEKRKNTEAVTLLKSQHAEAAARFRKQLEEVQESARDARTQAAEASDQLSTLAGRIAEAREMAERAMADKATAEQHAAAVEMTRQAVVDELARVRQAHDRLARKAEEADRNGAAVPGRKTNRKSVASSGSAGRKSLTAVPVVLSLPDPEDVPAVPGVSPELVARVVAAMRKEPDANQERIAELAGTTDRTVRNVRKGLAAVPVQAEDASDRAAV